MTEIRGSLEWADVYLGANLKITPSRERRRAGRLWIDVEDIGSSLPLARIKLRECASNWQNAPKRSIAWKPSTVAALKISHLSEGGMC